MATTPMLVDRFNRPLRVDKKALADEVARPSLTGVRQAWDTRTAVAGLTPARLDGILRQANQGDLDALLTLAEEMEERDPHYASVLSTRKLAVTGLERKVTWANQAGSEDPRAEEIQEACEGLLGAPEMEDAILDLLDGIAKPYSAVEIIWNTELPRWTPMDYRHRDPRWFQFDRETGRELRLREAGAIDGVALPPATFMIQLARNKSGLAARRGLARVVAFSFVCKLYGLKDWMAYAEIFGIPLRLGKYDASASPDDVRVLKQAVFGLGSDAAAVIPESMTIEFPDLGAATGGAELFNNLVCWIDNQVSKAVLGQAGTTDMQKGGGYAQSQTLNEVRGDLTKADARGMSATLTRDLFLPFVRFNWGPDAPVPNAELVVEEPEDTDALSTALERLVPLGLKVGQREIRKKFRLSEPDDDEELLTAPQLATAPIDADPEADPDADPANENDRDRPPARQGLARDYRRPALTREAPRDRHDRAQAALDDAQLLALQDWEPTFGAEAAAVMDLVRNADSFDAVLEGLKARAADLAAPAAARNLARAMFEAAAIGDGERREG